MRRTIGLIIILVAIVLALPTVIPTVAGCKVYNVVSASMEPEIPVGSMICVKPIDVEHIEVDDIITFYSADEGSMTVTHRVVEIDPEAREFITKGDANADVDLHPISYDDYVGKVISHIPHLGNIGMFLTSMYGKCILLGLVLVGWVMISGQKSTQKS